MNLAVYPTYEEIFPNSTNVDIKTLLKDIPTFNIVEKISFYSACLDYKMKDFNVQNYIYLDLIKSFDPKLQNEISERINDSTNGKTSVIFHKVSCLLILSNSLINFMDGKKSILSPEDNLNILKAFLYYNSEYSSRLKRLMESLEGLPHNDKLIGVHLIMEVGQNEFFNPEKDIVEQSYKLNYFDEFLKIDNTIGDIYYAGFLNEKNINSLKEIIKFIWNIYFKMLQRNSKFNPKDIKDTIHITEDFQIEYKFFESLTINPKLESLIKNAMNSNELDFKPIRENPLFAKDKTHFVILDNNFFVDKLFQSMLFDYFNFMHALGYTKGFPIFKTYYSEIFIEKFLLKKHLDFIFANININTKQTGDIFKKKDKFNRDYSDYYVRIRNKILLFECKDRIMKADVKYSFDYNKIINDINEKFINGSGVDQFINVIKSINENNIPFDNLTIPISDLSILPILVYTDSVFDSAAVNFYVNKIFFERINGLNFSFKIEKIIMINLDTIIRYQDLFHEKKVNFVNVLEKYNRFVQRNEKNTFDKNKWQTKSFIDFNNFLIDYLFQERKFKHTDIKMYKNLYKELYS